MTYTIGNTSGPYFREGLFNILRDLGRDLVDEHVVMENPHLHYDNQQDFHCLTFTSAGHKVFVRLYKAFAAYVDDKELWIACPVYNSWRLARSIKNKLKELSDGTQV